MGDTIKQLAVLGSTGSIGQQTLDVVRALPHRFHIMGLAAGKNIALLSLPRYLKGKLHPDRLLVQGENKRRRDKQGDNRAQGYRLSWAEYLYQVEVSVSGGNYVSCESGELMLQKVPIPLLCPSFALFPLGAGQALD
ncbi:1-deoxy-D-xylulose 5-phosphate reductoisomerase [subsurface metagenome]